MSLGEQPFYKIILCILEEMRRNNPDQARNILHENGLWAFLKAIEAGDSAAAHRLLDMGLFTDPDEKMQAERWLTNAWSQFPYADDGKNREDLIAELQKKDLIAELQKKESCMRFAKHWDAMLGLAIALREKELAWRYAQKGGRSRQWGNPGEKWIFHRLLHLTKWEEVLLFFRARCFFTGRGLEYNILYAKLVYDTMKELTPSVEDRKRDRYQLLYENADAELFFRPITDTAFHNMFSVDCDVWLECSFHGADADPFSKAACTGPSWERILAMKVDSDFAGMFAPGELIGAALADYGYEFGFGAKQILDKKVRRSFAARLGHLHRQHPRPPKQDTPQ